MFRPQALRLLSRPATGAVRIPRRTFLSPDKRPSTRPVERLNVERLHKESYDYYRNRQAFLIAGATAGIVSFTYTAYKLKKALDKPAKLDSNLPSSDPLAQADAAHRKVVVHDEDGREIVPTGNSVVPTFPRTIDLPTYTPPDVPESAVTTSAGAPTTEYTLVGLGLRTVSFLGIGVYVVGYYVATPDIAELQNALVKKINPIATTLIPGEREQLRAALLDPAQSEELWEELLSKGIPSRSAFRIVPVKNTDWHHLRDGFVRSIQARTESVKGADSFGQAMQLFRQFFNRGKVPYGKELLLIRDAQGRLGIAFEGSGSTQDKRPTGRELLGLVEDSRVSHALWLNYLAGKKVASEPARASIVEGIMEFVERPVGTVAVQVI